MKVRVIGSSPAWPNPGSAHAGYAVEDGGVLLLDCGPGVLARLRDARLRVDAVAVTHFHLDHWGDLVPWAWLNAYRPGDGIEAELWLPPGGRAELASFAARWGNEGMFERAFALREYEPGRPFDAVGMSVEPRRVDHYGLKAFGFRVTAGGTTFAYSGDTGPTRALAELAAGADLFLCEATLASGEDDATPRGHLSADEALAAADGRIVLTHRPIELAAPAGVEVAYDGLVLAP